MFLFIRLILAHFLADFLFQSKLIQRLKYKGILGNLPHFFIVVAVNLLVCWPYLKLSFFWLVIVFIGIAHLIQDYVTTGLLKGRDNFWDFIIDQSLHIAAISLIFLTPFAQLSAPDTTASLFASLYNNNLFCLYLIAIIASAYSGFYLLLKFRKTLLKDDYAYSDFEKYYGMFERGTLVSLVFIGGFPLALIMIMPFLRFLAVKLFKKNYKIGKIFLSFPDLSLSFILAFVAGAGVHLAALWVI